MPDYNSFEKNRSIGMSLRQRWDDADKFNGRRKGGKNFVELWGGFWPSIPSDLRHSNINPSGISL
jgi:hypothetical protein